MSSSSVNAYDLASRVAAYDADMDLMHPNRHKMAEVISSVLGASDQPPSLIVDLGSGTGFLLSTLLRHFPKCRAVAIDGAGHMAAEAKIRLGAMSDRVTFVVGDFRSAETFTSIANADAVVSAYALHHLNAREKRKALDRCRTVLKPGGWLLNADLVIAESEELESLVQAMRVRGVTERAAGKDPRFLTDDATRAFLDELERNEHDQPLKLSEDLDLIHRCGYRNTILLWKDTREAVYGGIR